MRCSERIGSLLDHGHRNLLENERSDSRFSLVSAHQEYRPGSLEHRLVQILNTYVKVGVRPRGRGLKINRTEIAKQLGVTKSALTPHKEILSCYERALGIEAHHVARIPEMKEWLSIALEAGSLETFNNKQIKRKQFFEAFGISGSTLLAYPEIAAILEPYDALVAGGEYVPQHHREKLKLLSEQCSSMDFLGKGRTYAYGKASAILGLSEERLRWKPYSTEINRILKSLTKIIVDDPLVVTRPSRQFSFQYLSDLGWIHTVAKQVVAALQEEFATLSDTWFTRLSSSLADFATWLSANPARHVRHCFELTRLGRATDIDPRDWAETHSDYGAAMRSRWKNVGTRNSGFVATNSVLDSLSRAGIFPEVAIPFRKDPKGEESHLPSLAEALPRGAGQRSNLSNADQYIAFATQKFADAEKYGHTAGDDQGIFLANLRSEIERKNIPPDLRPDEAIAQLLQRRIDLLKEAFSKRLTGSRSRFEYGQELLQHGVNSDVYWDTLFGADVKKQNTSKVLREYFPHIGEGERGISNLLALVNERYDGIYPANDKVDRPEGAFFIKRAREYGGLPLLQSYLLPDIDGVGSVVALYQCESGSNIAVGRTLFSTCVEPSQVPNHSCITGFKAKAQGKAIFTDLPSSSPAVKGIDWLKNAAEPIRKTLPVDDRKILAIVRLQGVIKTLDERAYRDFFKSVVAEIPDLSELNLTPNMIRPTIILLDAISRGGSLRTALATGQHGVGVNQGYSDKFPVRLPRDWDIRDFGDLFEAVVFDGDEKAVAFFGIETNDFEARLKRATKTGIGILCGDRYGRPGNEGAECKSMDCWNNCPQIIVLARKQDIAILQLWQRSLRLFEPDWIRDRPERWLNVWLPWLEFVNVLEEKMRVKHEAVWRGASQIADKIVANPNYQPFRIF